MNEGDDSFLSTETRKKRRKPGFRYSSKKELDRSRLSKTTAKTTVKKVLSYPDSGGPAVLEPVEELDGVRIETSNSHHVCEFPQRGREATGADITCTLISLRQDQDPSLGDYTARSTSPLNAERRKDQVPAPSSALVWIRIQAWGIALQEDHHL